MAHRLKHFYCFSFAAKPPPPPRKCVIYFSYNSSSYYYYSLSSRRAFDYRKIPKTAPGAYIFPRPFLRGLYSEGLIYGGKFAFQNLIVGRKFTVFALFDFVFEGNFQVQVPGGAYIWRGDLTGGFYVTSLGGGGAYTWRGLFSEVYRILIQL